MIKAKDLETEFDRPERKELESVIIERDLFRNKNDIIQIIEGYPEIVCILNEYRQIVAWNKKSMLGLNIENEEGILGKRFGEAIKCIHSAVMEGGCGTSKFCKQCGLANSVKDTIETDNSVVDECRVTSDYDGIETSFDFRVHTKTIIIDGKKFVFCALKDIADEKRRLALEKIFFHDVLNTSGAIQGLSNMLKEAEDDEELEELADALIDSSNQLLSEILAQRELRSAEEGNLEIKEKETTVNHILKNVYSFYSKHNLTKNKNLIIDYQNEDKSFISDPVHLIRSFSNLVKNAIEASKENDDIKIYAIIKDDKIFFSVYNNLVIPENIQLQIFKRSFTTKGSVGRGIGTYSVKLLVEQYLKGTVSFVSTNETGTVFTIGIPLNN